ncbi:Isotrichodermin C-15 hydroxylase [Neolecta irregularis DAH-3]|uniref:Isotrichodermin C-15 hydroxylase n=1 Tax=Neolecta irregularis (strain DAH-3) TaxID=1198029 RepID=A0A1U7LQ45_NEOID|nr:Isotrichodermin C-15 hydroxylase [Neolecta irregularis DAH-3]|eukprot:OLL24641.1 Isotrichodermin C-15 hydroxylase [Neolecta irregularis DAH-3]
MQLGQQSVSKIKERMENPSDRKDFFYYLTDPERLKSAPQDFRDRLHSTCVLLMFVTSILPAKLIISRIAGSDTTSAALTGSIYLLATHSSVLEKLKEEVNERFPDPASEIEDHKLTSLPYLNAVIEESMRLYPAAVGPLPRVSSEENVVAGQKIPPNCVISVASYAIYRDPRYFTRPDSFIPERWIDPAFERDQTLGKLAFQPFSLGPRGCLGRNMAYTQIRLFLAHFVLQFRPELEDPTFHYEIRDQWTTLTPPLFVKFRSLKGDSA